MQNITPEALKTLKSAILRKYRSCILSYRAIIWPTVIKACPDKNAFMHNGISQVNFDIKNLNLAIDEIAQDVVFIKEFALQCGTEFIGVQFETIDPLLQKELFYQLTSRHVNQETLGLIFDTINIFYRKPANSLVN